MSDDAPNDASNDAPDTGDPWVDAELVRLRGAEGEALLAGLHGLARHYAELDNGDQQAEWLQTLLRVASKQSRFDWELRAFGELRALFLSDAARYGYLRGRVCWYFKWLVERLPEHAEVTRETIESVFADMEAFYRSAGESLRPVYSLRCQAAVYMGQADEAKRQFELWQAEPAGNSDDCPACEADRKILYVLDRGDMKDAIALATQLASGEISRCDETPATFSKVLMTALMTGHTDLAAWMQQASQRYVRKLPNMLGPLSWHVMYLALTGDLVRARRLGKVMLARAAEVENDMARGNAYRAAAIWLTVEALTGNPTIALPRSIFVEASPTLPVPEAVDRCLAQAWDYARRLDERNGTGRYAERMKGTEQMIRAMATRPGGSDDVQESEAS